MSPICFCASLVYVYLLASKLDFVESSVILFLLCSACASIVFTFDVLGAFLQICFSHALILHKFLTCSASERGGFSLVGKYLLCLFLPLLSGPEKAQSSNKFQQSTKSQFNGVKKLFT